MNAALIVGGTVANVIVFADGTRLSKKLAAEFGGDALVVVEDGVAVSPGWGYDPKADAPFAPVPDPAD